MTDPMAHAQRPTLPRGTTLREATRQLFEPTKAEVSESERSARASSQRIRAAIAELKRQGRW